MNYRFILRTLGFLLLIEATLLLFPLGVALGGNENVLPYLYTIIILLIFGGLLSLIKVKNKSYFAKDGLMITALSWISLSIFGALPFFFLVIYLHILMLSLKLYLDLLQRDQLF